MSIGPNTPLRFVVKPKDFDVSKRHTDSDTEGMIRRYYAFNNEQPECGREFKAMGKLVKCSLVVGHPEGCCVSVSLMQVLALLEKGIKRRFEREYFAAMPSWPKFSELFEQKDPTKPFIERFPQPILPASQCPETKFVGGPVSIKVTGDVLGRPCFELVRIEPSEWIDKSR